jgi:fatty acid desaturase
MFSDLLSIPVETLVRDFNVVIGLGVFFAYVVIDALNTYYTSAVAEKRPAAAATTGAVVYILLAFGIVSFTENILYIVPLVLGSWIGTFLVVWHTKRKTHTP